MDDHLVRRHKNEEKNIHTLVKSFLENSEEYSEAENQSEFKCDKPNSSTTKFVKKNVERIVKNKIKRSSEHECQKVSVSDEISIHWPGFHNLTNSNLSNKTKTALKNGIGQNENQQNSNAKVKDSTKKIYNKTDQLKELKTTKPKLDQHVSIYAGKVPDAPKKSVASLEYKKTNILLSPMSSKKENVKKKLRQSSTYTKQSSNWKLRQINEIEEKLRQHPLALYPHLEEYIPYNIFEEVTEILDPEMKKALDEENYVDPERLDDFSEVFKFNPTSFGLEEEQVEVNNVYEESESRKIKDLLYKLQKGIPTEKINPYKAIFAYDEREKKARLLTHFSKTLFAVIDFKPPSDTVTIEFCEYLATLSKEDKPPISKDDVKRLFANGIETKPPPTVPIQFIAMEGIPLELRRLTGGPDAIEMMNERMGTCDLLTPSEKLEKLKSTKQKFRFGAWYLDPNEWRKMPYDEPLKDPKSSSKNILETNIKDLDLDNELASMHGTKLFLDFAIRKKKRTPEFLKSVVHIMSENNIDEKSSKLFGLD